MEVLLDSQNLPERIALLTWNTQKAMRERRFREEFRGLLKNQYDFFALQEVGDEAHQTLNSIIESKTAYSWYRMVRLAHPHIVHETGKLALVYNSTHWELIQSNLHPFTSRNSFFGILVGTFRHQTTSALLRVCSVHQHSMGGVSQRTQDSRAIQRILSQLEDMPTIIAGDFNVGYPKEVSHLKTILADTHMLHTEHIGPTCYWRRLDIIRFRSVIGFILGILFNVRLPIDHILTTPDVYRLYALTTQAFRHCVASDHVPIECIAQKRPLV